MALDSAVLVAGDVVRFRGPGKITVKLLSPDSLGWRVEVLESVDDEFPVRYRTLMSELLVSRGDLVEVA